jgi:hypothetical protein
MVGGGRGSLHTLLVPEGVGAFEPAFRLGGARDGRSNGDEIRSSKITPRCGNCDWLGGTVEGEEVDSESRVCGWLTSNC